jgi:hypothetical protein
MNLRLLKTLVVLMGLLLVAGVVALAVGIASRVAHHAPTLPAAFNAPAITLPHGSSIAGTSTAADRIVLQVDLADGNVELVVIDLATGQLVGIVPLREAP